MLNDIIKDCQKFDSFAYKIADCVRADCCSECDAMECADIFKKHGLINVTYDWNRDIDNYRVEGESPYRQIEIECTQLGVEVFGILHLIFVDCSNEKLAQQCAEVMRKYRLKSVSQFLLDDAPIWRVEGKLPI